MKASYIEIVVQWPSARVVFTRENFISEILWNEDTRRLWRFAEYERANRNLFLFFFSSRECDEDHSASVRAFVSRDLNTKSANGPIRGLRVVYMSFNARVVRMEFRVELQI